MSAELDMSQYLALFLQEGEEQLEILEQELIKLEQDPSTERMQVIFRAAHTLKGSSRAMDFQSMAELTHEMESVLDGLRQNQFVVTTDIANVLFRCLDCLSEMKEQIASGKKDSVSDTTLVADLQAIYQGGAAADQFNTVTSATPQAVEAGILFEPLAPELLEALSATNDVQVYVGSFRLAEDCVMKFVRVFMITSLIEEHGELFACTPSREDLEEELFEQDFRLFFTLKTPVEEFRNAVAQVGDLDWSDISAWEEGEALATPAAPSAQANPAETVQARQTEETLPILQRAAQEPTPKDSSPVNDSGKKPDSGQTVRVDVSRLDNLMNLVGELVIDRTRIAQLGADLSAKYEDANIDALAETVGHIARITSDLQDQIMKARMMPIETVFNRFPRVIRDLAQKLDKDVKLEMLGGDTELDRSVIEVIGDPLLHVLRNSLDHGLERPDDREAAGKSRQGTVTISARHQENHIVIEIIDDGRGIDVERVKAKAVSNGLTTAEAAEKLSDKEILQFIFASGVSTASEVSEVSGRGVGMDIVRSNLQKLGGIIELETNLGEGTKFTFRLPLTLAIIRGLLVQVLQTVYVVPLGSVVETLLVNESSIQKVNKQEVIVIRGVTTPLIRLKNVFSLQRSADNETEEELYVVIVGLAEQRVGLVVDRLIGEQEVVIKSLSRFCGDVPGVSGATILGDGNVALIMDVNTLIRK